MALYLIKVIPMLLSGICLLNTVCSYYGIDLVVLSYIGSTSLLSIIMLYLMSYVFRFCIYHRMFIHYVTVNTVLNAYDYHIGIPLDNK